MNQSFEVTVAVYRSRLPAEIAARALQAAGLPTEIVADAASTRFSLRVRSADAAEAREHLASSTVPAMDAAAVRRPLGS